MKNSNLSIIALAFLCTASYSQSSFTDSRDGKTYKTVKIGEQTWMAENLNFKAESSKCYGEDGLAHATLTNGIGDGVNLPSSEVQANCAKHGRLYDWATAMNIDTSYNNSGGNKFIWDKEKDNARKNKLWGGSDVKHQGVCPSGWHLPNSDEWLSLAKFVGDSIAIDGTVIGKMDKSLMTIANKSFDAGVKLKSVEGWMSSSIAGIDAFGFAALPSGNGQPGHFYYIGYQGYWWSATENNATVARSRSMLYNYVDLNRRTNNKADLLSVRCIQN
jgi:uncharacterized protein (TIGR02145 family)